MSLPQSEHLDFSGLFKLDVLIHLDVATYSFYEVGLKKFFAFSSDKELVFLFINAQSERFEKNYDWDFLDNPIFCMCFEPSGTWLLIVSEQKVLLVPFLPLFIPQSDFDHKWSLSGVTVLPLSVIPQPTSVVCWLTKESENVLIIGSKTGAITFYSLDSQTVVGECKVSGEINDLQICFDDSLDLLALLISGGKSQQWKLVLEHRSYGYNWLQQARAQNDKDKKDGFMSYIKQLSKDKITFFIQGIKDDSKSQTVEYVLKPVEYLPVFRKGSNNWSLSAQYVEGRHFLTAFELNEGTMILESPEEDTPSRTLRPFVKKDDLYIQGLWSQRLVYLLRKNELEIHSSNFSIIQGDAILGVKRDFSELWSAELIGDVRRAHLMTARDASSAASGWQEPTFLCDLQLPRFTLESCLVVTTCGAYIMNTVSEPCEWLVGLIIRGGVGAEQSAAALGAPVGTLLRAAADMLMSRGKLAPAQYLYSLSKSQPDGWVARLGVFGRTHELSLYKHSGNIGSLSNSAITIKLLALLLKMATNEEQKFDTDVKFTTLSSVELLELSSFAAAIGQWDLVPVFSIHRGHLNLLLAAIKARGEVCRGAINCLLQQKCIVPLLLEENGQWLFDYIARKIDEFDTSVLKCLCLWLNPLQDQLRPVMRDLKQGITTVYTTRMLNLISTFVQIASAIEARYPCPEIYQEIEQNPETWKDQFTPKRALSCGLAHWAVADEGSAKILMTNTPVNTDLIGRVIDVACGRHHTLVLTENGIYSAGDNTYGQLGVGAAWRGAIGDAAGAGGALRLALHPSTAPVAAVAAGHYHSCAIDVGGRLYTWGWGVHGQLGLGSIDDQWTPQMVTKFQGRKVMSVGCGACHTVTLMANGEVWAMGAGVFGQIGGGARDKAAVPVRVSIAEHVAAIAVGYFHNLALTSKGQVYVWGGSPQQVRAAAARRVSEPPTPTPTLELREPHLKPQLVDTCNVQGSIVTIAAGWHHSCLITNTGVLYSWGLNFDGQLGSGDRKQTCIPTVVKIRKDMHRKRDKSPKSPTAETLSIKTKAPALVACGGDFTIYIDHGGRIFTTGNTHLQDNSEKEKGINRVIMMKTTKRVIKIPASKINNKFLFQKIDKIKHMFSSDTNEMQRKPLDPRFNPLASMKDFRSKSWADDIIMILNPWINEDMLNKNPNMSAKLAYHNNNHSVCLKFLLDNLKRAPGKEKPFVTHCVLNKEKIKDERHKINTYDNKIAITNIMSKRIKEVSLSILNEAAYPVIDVSTYQALPCCCDELKYIRKAPQPAINKTDREISSKAAKIIDKCMTMFPINNDLWETCFRLSKNFYLDNNLPIADLEAILFKYMASNANTMAAAIMYSSDCAQYCEILSPKLYLNMCSQIMDTWG